MRICSAEVWDVLMVGLFAGELGYLVRCVYMILTGFTAENSAGSKGPE